jgi:hypothetical protein
VLKFLSRKTKTEYITPEFYKDWGNASHELECLGRRLDATRQALAYLKDKPENHWALRQWRETEAILLRKWKNTIRMKETGLRQIVSYDSGPKIDYAWWEGSYEVAMRIPIMDGIMQWMQEKTGNTDYSLDRAWEMAREEKLQKARQGLA